MRHLSTVHAGSGVDPPSHGSNGSLARSTNSTWPLSSNSADVVLGRSTYEPETEDTSQTDYQTNSVDAMLEIYSPQITQTSHPGTTSPVHGMLATSKSTPCLASTPNQSLSGRPPVLVDEWPDSRLDPNDGALLNNFFQNPNEASISENFSWFDAYQNMKVDGEGFESQSSGSDVAGQNESNLESMKDKGGKKLTEGATTLRRKAYDADE